MTILANGRAMMAAVMAANATDQSRPFRDHRRTLSPSCIFGYMAGLEGSA